MYLIRHEIFCSKTHRYISGQKCLLCNSSSQKKIKSHMNACHRDLLGLGSGRKHCKHCKKQFQYTPQMEAHEFTCVFYQKYLQGNLCLICNQTVKNERVHLRKIHRVLYLSHVNEYQLLYQSHIKENEFRLAKDLNCQFCQKLFKTHFRGSLNESNLI